MVDEIIWEEEGEDARETFKSFPKLRARIESFVRASLLTLLPLSTEELVQQRYGKYRKLGTFSLLDAEQRFQAVSDAKTASASSQKRPATSAATKPAIPYSLLTKHLAEEIVLGERSKYRKLAPTAMNVPLIAGPIATLTAAATATAAARNPAPLKENTAKYVLDTMGPEYLCREWLPKQKRVLVTDTTMRDAHQVGANLALDLSALHCCSYVVMFYVLCCSHFWLPECALRTWWLALRSRLSCWATLSLWSAGAGPPSTCVCAF